MAGPYITLPQVITRHLRTGKVNVGMYRLQKFDAATLGMHWQIHKVGAEHEREAIRRGENKMPVAIALGGDPAMTYAATAPLPPEIDEYLFAGFLRRTGVELVPCRTIDLEVPANAEIVPRRLCRPRRDASRRTVWRPHRLLLTRRPVPRLSFDRHHHGPGSDLSRDRRRQAPPWRTPIWERRPSASSCPCFK